jgi:HAD superfamily hydrolase (TIGR01484 family)
MQWRGLATDFDGTLAGDGVVAPSTDAALARWRASGRVAVMVTGRELPSLRATYEHLDAFDLVVAENGGLLYRPADDTRRVIAHAPRAELVAALQARGVPLSLGEVVVATWAPHLDTVTEVLAQLGLTRDVAVILNKGAVMLLPAGVDKASGLVHAAEELGVPLSAFVGVGDAENDVPLFRACGLGVAVGNALDDVKACAGLVTTGARGAGVEELIDRLLASS